MDENKEPIALILGLRRSKVFSLSIMARQEWLFQRLYGDKVPNLEELGPDDKLRRQGELIIAFFDAGVDTLRNPGTFPNQQINELMTLFWRLVGNKITPTVLHTGIPGLAFWGEVRGVESMGMVFVPQTYAELCVDDPAMQLGALVFTASQARDFYNGRQAVTDEVKARAYAYEGEFLKTLIETAPAFTPNEYQRRVLIQFADGIETNYRKLKYQSMPFVMSKS